MNTTQTSTGSITKTELIAYVEARKTFIINIMRNKDNKSDDYQQCIGSLSILNMMSMDIADGSMDIITMIYGDKS